MNRPLLSATLAALLAVFSSTAAMGQQSATTADNTIDWAKHFLSRVELHGYAQAGYSYDNSGPRTVSSLNLKRTLFWAKARITNRWSFLFMHDFNSVVQEFYTDYRVTRDAALTVRLGQFKHSYSMENPLSPTALELIDVYSQAVLYLAGEGPDPLFGANYGRDLGLMIYGDLAKGRLHYELALMNGQGINCRDGNSDKDVIAKLEYRPTPELRLVASGQKGRGHAVGEAAWNPAINKGDDYRRDRYSVGLEYKPAPLSLRLEWLGGKDGDVGSQGGYATANIHLTDKLDAIASAEYFDRNTDLDYDQTNLTAGLQYWFYKKCRLQLQYTRCHREWDKDYNWLQAQVQVAF